MTGFGTTRTRRSPRSRGRTWQRNGPDRVTLGIVGLVCGIAGLFVLGILLGPIAVLCGWLAMGRRWTSTRVPPVVAVTLGAIDTLLAVLWLF